MLEVHAERLGDVAILNLQGHIVRGTEAEALRDAVLSKGDARIVVLDLTRVDVIDAGGLGTLLSLRQWSQSNGIELRLVNLTKPVQEVFAITRLDSVFNISFQHDGASVTRDGDAARAEVQRARLSATFRRSHTQTSDGDQRRRRQENV
jgi:anti-anti-sigma factor